MRLKFKHFQDSELKEFQIIEGYFDRYELSKDQKDMSNIEYTLKVYKSSLDWEIYDEIVYFSVDGICLFENL